MSLIPESSPVVSTKIPYPDLTQRPPRSFHVRLGGYVILARMLDKGRAKLAGRNGEYNYNSYTDQHLVRFLGFDPEALLKETGHRKRGRRDPSVGLGQLQNTAHSLGG